MTRTHTDTKNEELSPEAELKKREQETPATENYEQSGGWGLHSTRNKSSAQNRMFVCVFCVQASEVRGHNRLAAAAVVPEKLIHRPGPQSPPPN